MSPQRPLYTIPIAQRPPHGPLISKLLFPAIVLFAIIVGNIAQFVALLALLIPFGIGRRVFDDAIGRTKEGVGSLLILVTVLFGPTSLVLTSDTPLILSLCERNARGNVTKINLPDRLVIIANHQTYLDWLYLWIISRYAGHARGLTILLKTGLRNIPVIGWGLRFFKFIFMKRSWAADREHLEKSLRELGNECEKPRMGKRHPLWLLLFPEGTIVSDEERCKSVKYAEREGIDDLQGMLHPRSTGLLFCLRTLLPAVPDLQLLDLTIGYEGVPAGKYPQEWYNVQSVFFRSVPPPAVHIHLRLYDDIASTIPSVVTTQQQSDQGPAVLPTPEESREFEMWLRGLWLAKEKRLEAFSHDQKFESQTKAKEVVPIRMSQWRGYGSALGAGGFGTLAAVAGVVMGVAYVVS